MRYMYSEEFPFLNIKNSEIVDIYMSKEKEEDIFLLKSIYNGSTLCIDFENIVRNFSTRFNICTCSKIDTILKIYIEYAICQFLEIGYYEYDKTICRQEHIEELKTICDNNKVANDFLFFEKQLGNQYNNCFILQFIKNEVFRKINTYIDNPYLYAYCGYIADNHVPRGNNIVMFKNLTGNSF